MGRLTFLKLGGSLITDKMATAHARVDVLARLAAEIAEARAARPGLQIVLGHGSGSFGHVPARKYGTRAGVHNPQEWLGFVEVWRQARDLTEIVVRALLEAGLPVIGLPPSAAVIAENGRVLAWNTHPLRHALDAGLIPLINGDVIFDTQRGGTILSTEDLFFHLALEMTPDAILLAGKEDGVFSDYPACQELLARITPADYTQIAPLLRGSAAVDVTGGMEQKVASLLELLRKRPTIRAAIFSGQHPGLVRQALLGDLPGTLLHT